MRRRHLPAETLIEIGHKQYSGFTRPTIIDCNSILEKSIDQLVDKLASGKMRLEKEMDQSLVESMRLGVMQSPSVDRRIKDVLRGEEPTLPHIDV